MPAVLLKVPFKHAMHTPVPEYLPGSQLEHGPPAGPSKPERQVQLAAAMLPGTELELAGQSSQLLPAIIEENFPCSQRRQLVAPPGKPLYEPAKQSMQSPEPASLQKSRKCFPQQMKDSSNTQVAKERSNNDTWHAFELARSTAHARETSCPCEATCARTVAGCRAP